MTNYMIMPNVESSRQLPVPQTPYGQWQKTLIVEPECQSITQSIKLFVESPGDIEILESNEEKATAIHAVLDNAHTRLMRCDVFRDISEQEELVYADFLEKWVLNKLYSVTFGRSSEIRKRDRRVGRHIRYLSGFLEIKHFDLTFEIPESFLSNPENQIPGKNHQFPYESVEQCVSIMLEDAIVAFIKLETVSNTMNKLTYIELACQMITEFIRKFKSVVGMDDLMPLVIYCIMKAKMGQIFSNIDYIETYRTPWRKTGEQYYFFTTFVSAVTFLQNLSADNCTDSLREITKEQFVERYQQCQESETVQNQNEDLSKRSSTIVDGGPGNTGLNSQFTGGDYINDNIQQSLSQNSQGNNIQPTNSGTTSTNLIDSESNPSGLANGGGGGTANQFNFEVDRGKLRSCTLQYRNIARASDLRIGEINQLLREYKDMASIISDLKMALGVQN